MGVVILTLWSEAEEKFFFFIYLDFITKLVKMPGLECQICPDKKTLSSLQRLETHVQKMHKGFTTASKAKAIVQQWLSEGTIAVPKPEGKTCPNCKQKDINPKVFAEHVRFCTQLPALENAGFAAAGAAAVQAATAAQAVDETVAMDVEEGAREVFRNFLCSEGNMPKTTNTLLSWYDKWVIHSKSSKSTFPEVCKDLLANLVTFYDEQSDSGKKAMVYKTYKKLVSCKKTIVGGQATLAYKEKEGKLVPGNEKVFYSRPRAMALARDGSDDPMLGKGYRKKDSVIFYCPLPTQTDRKRIHKPSQLQVPASVEDQQSITEGFPQPFETQPVDVRPSTSKGLRAPMLGNSPPEATTSSSKALSAAEEAALYLAGGNKEVAEANLRAASERRENREKLKRQKEFLSGIKKPGAYVDPEGKNIYVSINYNGEKIILNSKSSEESVDDL